MSSIKEYINVFGTVISSFFKSKDKLELEAVQKHPENIKEIQNPSERVQLTAITEDASLIQHIHNPSENVMLAAITKDVSTIKHISNPTERVQMAVIAKDATLISHIPNASEKVMLTAIDKNASAIQHINNPSEAVKLRAVTLYPEMIKFLKDPSEEIQLAAVKTNPYAIQYIKYPTDNVLESARKLNLGTEKYIEKFQIKAVQRNPLHIQNISDPSVPVQNAAVNANPLTIQLIAKPSEETQLAAIRKNPSVIRYIKDPSEKIQLEAVKANPGTILYIESPTTATCKQALNSVYKDTLQIDVESINNLQEHTKALFTDLSLTNPEQVKLEDSLFINNHNPISSQHIETENLLNNFKNKLHDEKKSTELLQEIKQKFASQYGNLGYSNISNEIMNMKPGEMKEIEICDNKGKALIADISIDKNNSVAINNYRIKEKATGLVESLNLKDIDLCSHSSSQVKKMLAGNKVEVNKGPNAGKLLGLSKTPAGWGITIGKQALQAADSSAAI